METSQFDERYIAGLRNRDPEVESHFAAYFRMPVWLKARRQLRTPEEAEDAVQETLLRALRYFNAGKSLEFPERLPAFVLSVCHNVILERLRAKGRDRQAPENTRELVDHRANPELQVVTEQRKQLVWEIVNELPDKDRELLLALLEEMDTEELCRRFGVKPAYLRVLLYRARQRFRTELEKREAKDRTSTQGAG